MQEAITIIIIALAAALALRGCYQLLTGRKDACDCCRKNGRKNRHNAKGKK